MIKNVYFGSKIQTQKLANNAWECKTFFDINNFMQFHGEKVEYNTWNWKQQPSFILVWGLTLLL